MFQSDPYFSISVVYCIVKTIAAISTMKHNLCIKPTNTYSLTCAVLNSLSHVSAKCLCQYGKVNLKYQSKAWQEATCHSLQLDRSPHHQAFNQSCGRLAVFVVSSWDMKEVVSGDLSAVVTSVALIEFCRVVRWRWMQTAMRIKCREYAQRWH